MTTFITNTKIITNPSVPICIDSENITLEKVKITVKHPIFYDENKELMNDLPFFKENGFQYYSLANIVPLTKQIGYEKALKLFERVNTTIGRILFIGHSMYEVITTNKSNEFLNLLREKSAAQQGLRFKDPLIIIHRNNETVGHNIGLLMWMLYSDKMKGPGYDPIDLCTNEYRNSLIDKYDNMLKNKIITEEQYYIYRKRLLINDISDNEDKSYINNFWGENIEPINYAMNILNEIYGDHIFSVQVVNDEKGPNGPNGSWKVLMHIKNKI